MWVALEFIGLFLASRVSLVNWYFNAKYYDPLGGTPNSFLARLLGWIPPIACFYWWCLFLNGLFYLDIGMK